MAHLSEQDRDDLVAYLDGELDEDTARQLEAKLSLDPEAGAEADALEQTWGLLDYLPRPEPSPSLTHRTLERLAVGTSSIQRSAASRWLVRLGWAAAVLVAIGAGLWIASVLWPARQGEDAEFLHALGQPELFGEEVDAHDDGHARATLTRYTEWLDRLDTGERDKIKSAADNQARLQVIRDMREQEWLSRQPKRHRDEVTKLQGQERSQRIDELRKKERRRRQDWQIATRFWDDVLAEKAFPAKLEDMPENVQVYVNEYLRPHLSREEQERLDKAEGWPKLPRTLIELADSHPLALLRPDFGPTRFFELPKEVQKDLRGVPPKKGKKEAAIPQAIVDAEGAWPKFAIVVADVAKKRNKILPHELWPYNFKC